MVFDCFLKQRLVRVAICTIIVPNISFRILIVSRKEIFYFYQFFIIFTVCVMWQSLFHSDQSINQSIQEDIDASIEYLFPSGLDPVARPMMKPPSEIFPRLVLCPYHQGYTFEFMQFFSTIPQQHWTSYFNFIFLFSSVSDPFHFDMDPT